MGHIIPADAAESRHGNQIKACKRSSKEADATVDVIIWSFSSGPSLEFEVNVCGKLQHSQ